MAPNVTVHFFAPDDINGTPILEITDEDTFFKGLKLTPDLYSLGGWELTLARAWGFQLFGSGAVQPEVFVRFLIHAFSDTTYYFGGVLNKRELIVVARDEIGEEQLVIGGTGPKQYMARAALGIEQRTGLGFNLDLPNGVWRWNESATAGRVLDTVFDEDAARTNPALSDLTMDFSDTNDSDGVPWANEITSGVNEYSTPIGSSLLDVIWDLEDLVDELVTVIHLGTVASPHYLLKAFQTYGQDMTGSSFGPGVGLLREGVNIANDSLQVTGTAFKKATHVIVEGKDDHWIVAIKPSWNPGEYVKWAKIEYTRSSSDAILEKAGLRWLRKQDSGDEQITVEIVPGDDPDNGYYFPSFGDPLQVGNTITLDTVADGSVHSPLDYNNSPMLVTGSDLTLGPAGSDATSDKMAKSWDVKVRLNWERASAGGSPDQSSATGACSCHPGPDAPNPGIPGTVTTATGAGEVNNNDSQGVTVAGGTGGLIAVLLTNAVAVTAPVYFDSSSDPSPQTMTVIGSITHPTAPTGTKRNGNMLVVAHLANPETSGAGASIEWGTMAGSQFGSLKGYWTTPSTATPTVTTAFGTGSTIEVTPPGTIAEDLVLMCGGWRIWSLGNASQTPIDLSSQADTWALPFNNSAGQNDGCWYGGVLAGSGIRQVNGVTSTPWVAAAIVLAGVGGIAGDTTLPVGQTGEDDPGDSPIFSPLDHIHEHGFLSDDALHYHDASQIDDLPGLEPPNVEDLVTDETNPDLTLVPDGSGGVEWVTPTSGSGIGEILISDTPSTPLVFADLIQNEAQTDLVYGDPA